MSSKFSSDSSNIVEEFFGLDSNSLPSAIGLKSDDKTSHLEKTHLFDDAVLRSLAAPALFDLESFPFRYVLSLSICFLLAVNFFILSIQKVCIQSDP